MTGEEIINKILEELNMKAPTFAEQIGVLYQRIFDVQRGKTKKISSQLANSIIKAYPQFSLTWLLTGEGNMINSGMIIGENKGNAAQSIAGNMVNVTMPESGTQKIIKPTGEVEIHRLDPSDKSNSEELDRLKQRIQDLERIIAEKDVTIQSKEATIQSKDDTIKSKDELISFLKGDRQ